MAVRSEAEVRKFRDDMRDSVLPDDVPGPWASEEQRGGYKIYIAMMDTLNWVLGDPTNANFEEEVVLDAERTAAENRIFLEKRNEVDSNSNAGGDGATGDK